MAVSFKNINLTEFINQNKQLLTIKELLTKINYTIDNLYIDQFWDSISDDKWIYLDDNLILWFGYSDIKHGKEQINKLIKKYIIENEDYKILNNTEFNDNKSCVGVYGEQDLSKNHGGHNKKYIIISPDSFKELCFYIGTNKSKEIKKYYIELEKVFKFYLDYQKKFKELELEEKESLLKQKENIINEQKEKIMDMKVDFQHTKLEFNDFVYIATNETYHKQNVYKIGHSKKLNKRMKQFNTFFINGHKMQYIYIYQCHNSKVLEQLLFTCLSNYRYDRVNELFNIKLDKLFYLIENINLKYTDIINFTNNILLDNTFDTTILNKDSDFPSGQIYPINYKLNNNSEFNLLNLQKYVNNKNICNLIVKDYKEYDFEDELLVNNKALSIELDTKYYFILYNNKVIYVCPNCGFFKKDRRSYLQHINKTNKCNKKDFTINTIEDIKKYIEIQKIQLYECNKCNCIFKTKDHYIRHLKANCKE